jgi:putative ABC transport system permease protein
VIASSLLLVVGMLSLALRLGLERRLALASLRTVLQLGLLGLVLKWVFDAQQWWIVVAMVASMVVNASVAAVRRTSRRYSGVWLSGLGAVTISTVFTTVVVISVVIPVRPWYEARYLIPLVGMILGNALTGLSLCLDRLMTDLDQKRSEVECWLSLGATAWEACRPHVREAVRTGMIPILNSMTVVGIVSIPGMMTGQILAGAPPEEAIRYQIVVMFMIAAATTMSAVIITLLSFRRLVTSRHQLASHRIREIS